MKMVIKRICTSVLALLLCASSLPTAMGAFTDNGTEDAVGVFAGLTPDYEKQYPSYYYNLFSEIKNLYLDTHLYEFTDRQLTEAFLMKLMKENPDLMKLFINTLLGTMDKYSAYYEVGMGINSDGSSAGYGIGIGDETSYEVRKLGYNTPGVYVTSVIEGSNALAAGISAGDRIVSVEGIPTEGLTPDAVLYLVKWLPVVEEEVFDENGVSLGIPNEPEYVLDEITGKKKYILHMTMARGDETYEVKLTKGRMFPSSVNFEVPNEKHYGYLQITDFTGQNVVADFRAALEEAKKEKVYNLIIDLRDNTGGIMDYAVEMANMLISEKDRLLFYINYRTKEEPEAVYSTGGGMTFDKITILCNEYTASASELFAMILRQHCSAILVGETTFGKAVGQETYSMINGDMFSITTFEMLTPAKDSYNEIGLVPDVEIKPCLARYEFPTDLEVFNYINYREMAEGTQSDTVKGFERRMVMFGFMRPEYADGVYDSATTSVISALELYLGKVPDGLLDDGDVEFITLIINKYKNRYYTYDSQLECAEMTFLSRSQGRRRAKELERESDKVQEMYGKYLRELDEQMMAEEEELKAKEQAEAENAENAQGAENAAEGVPAGTEDTAASNN